MLLSIQTVAAVVSSVYRELFTIFVQHERNTSVLFIVSIVMINNHNTSFANN